MIWKFEGNFCTGTENTKVSWFYCLEQLVLHQGTTANKGSCTGYIKCDKVIRTTNTNLKIKKWLSD